VIARTCCAVASSASLETARDGWARGTLGGVLRLIAPLGTEIHAIEDGVVIQASEPFYHGTNSIVVRHASGIVVRYCEIKANDPVVKLGDVVRSGQLIAHVGKMFVDSMLHFEVYSGTATGPLTQRGAGAFQRRADLIDPTVLLERLAGELTSAARTAAQG
jgi:murein DD-endopeptidase MepM/ murein hydrolase activator NlpD